MVELAAAALLNRHGEEEPVAVPGEHRFLVLQKGRRRRGSGPSVVRSDIGVDGGQTSDFVTVSDFRLVNVKVAPGVKGQILFSFFVGLYCVRPHGPEQPVDGKMIVKCVSWSR